MNKKSFAETYYQAFVRALAAVILTAVTLLLVFAFLNDWLPYQKDGNAFDTIYAIGEGEDTSLSE